MSFRGVEVAGRARLLLESNAGWRTGAEGWKATFPLQRKTSVCAIRKKSPACLEEARNSRTLPLLRLPRPSVCLCQHCYCASGAHCTQIVAGPSSWSDSGPARLVMAAVLPARSYPRTRAKAGPSRAEPRGPDPPTPNRSPAPASASLVAPCTQRGWVGAGGAAPPPRGSGLGAGLSRGGRG